jgi:metal transporter CNNM
MTYLIITILISLSALFSGLTIGLLGLDKSEIERKMRLGDKRAEKIYSVRKNGNLLLVTLLLGNVLVNSVLSVFLGDKFSGILAVLFSTILIVIFGEILPQAVFYRHALSVGYYFVPIVKVFIYILYPISWLFSKALDYFLGMERDTIWTKKEIQEIIKIHENSTESDIDHDEEKIVLGALSFSEKKAKEVMTPRSVVFAVEEGQILDTKLLVEMKKTGLTRIPVFREDLDNVVGVLNVKSLINLEEGKRVYDIYFRNKIFPVSESDNLDDVLNQFVKKKIHMAYVVNEHKTLLGIVTLEDLIEEILSEEIVDETDVYVDMREESRKNSGKK